MKNGLLIFTLFTFGCSTYTISPGVRFDNEMANIEKPPIIRNDRFKNDNFKVSVFLPKEKDLEEVFFDENNFSSENENLKSNLSILWKKAKDSKNLTLIQIENPKEEEWMKKIKKVQLTLENCAPVESEIYQYDFLSFANSYYARRRERTYPKLPKEAYQEEIQPRAGNITMKEIPTLRGIFIFPKACTVDLKTIIHLTIQTDEFLVFKFKGNK